TRFMAVFQCHDASKAGPVRSARVIDPFILEPATRILAYSGANQIVEHALQKHHLVLITESTAGSAMFRSPKPGVAFEHTLFANTAKLRKLGKKKFHDSVPSGVFGYGDLP